MAESSTFVIQYLADMSKVKAGLREIGSINKKVSAGLTNDFSKAVTVIDKRLKSIRSKPVFDKKLGKNVIKTFAQMETVFKGTDGKLKTMTQNFVLADGKMKLLNTTTKLGATSARAFGDNLKTLATRAALTIPVWFALRGSVFGVFRAIRDGLTDIADFDKALQKLKRNMSATSNDLEKDFKNVQKQITEFSLLSGKSVQDVTNAIQKFATVGFDTETALAGGIQATKLAVTLFGDASQTANAFARSLRVLTEDMKDPAEQQRVIAEALALTDKSWKSNAFLVNEFSGNLEKFAGTAKIANLSINDTIALLATLSTGGLGNRAGRLLRSTVLRALADIENITKTLDLNFDPTSQPTIVFVKELVKALDGLNDTKNVPVELAETFAELFNVRSTEPLGALTALQDTLNKNLSLKPDVKAFNKEFDNQTKNVNRLVERHKNLNKEMKRAFVVGLTGGNDYKSLLTSLIDTQEALNVNTERFGQIVKDAILVSGVASIIGFRKQLLGVLALLKSPIVLGGIAGFTILNFKAEAERLANEAVASTKDFNDLGMQVAEQINKGFSGQLSLKELDEVVEKIELFGPRLLSFDDATLSRALGVLKEIAIEERKIAAKKAEQTEEDEKQEISHQKRAKISEIVLKNELALLRLQGARNSQVTEAEQSLRKQFGIEKQAFDQLSDQLKKEREITEERRIRSRLGSDSIKLFKIAQTEGIEVARNIGDVLAGNLDFGTFVRRGGKELEVFKDQFARVFEEQQALSFFKGEKIPGMTGMRGGKRIAIKEEAIRKPVSTVGGRALLQQEQLMKALSDLKIQKQIVQAQTVVLSTSGNVEALRKVFASGQAVTGPSAGVLVESMAKQSKMSRQVVDLNLNIDGEKFGFQGTPDAIRELARQVTTNPGFLLSLENNIASALDNPQSKVSKAVDTKINDF